MAGSHHHHDHGHGTHHHHHVHAVSENRLGFAALVTGLFMFVEVIGGIVSGSLALLADAGHMLTDFASLTMAWFAFRIARRPADWKRTYGFDRMQVLVALVNGMALLVVAGWIIVEAVLRLREPVAVLGLPMLVIAVAGLFVNLIALFILHGADRDNLNVKGATLHVMGDLLGSVAAIVAAGLIVWFGWILADPILSLLIALILIRSAWFVVRESTHILLESSPHHLDVREIKRDLEESMPGISDVHHVHVWSLTQDRICVTLHARLVDITGSDGAVQAIKDRLLHRFGVEHATVEIESDSCADTPQDAPSQVRSG